MCAPPFRGPAKVPFRSRRRLPRRLFNRASSSRPPNPVQVLPPPPPGGRRWARRPDYVQRARAERECSLGSRATCQCSSLRQSWCRTPWAASTRAGTITTSGRASREDYSQDHVRITYREHGEFCAARCASFRLVRLLREDKVLRMVPADVPQPVARCARIAFAF